MTDLIELLREGLPEEAVLTDPDVTGAYAHDMASFCDAGEPDMVDMSWRWAGAAAVATATEVAAVARASARIVSLCVMRVLLLSR